VAGLNPFTPNSAWSETEHNLADGGLIGKIVVARGVGGTIPTDVCQIVQPDGGWDAGGKLETVDGVQITFPDFGTGTYPFTESGVLADGGGSAVLIQVVGDGGDNGTVLLGQAVSGTFTLTQAGTRFAGSFSGTFADAGTVTGTFAVPVCTQ
jgi:hypothetical protein